MRPQKMVEMELEQVETALEKIWELHDKLSDAIHTISRTHFAKSLKDPSFIDNNGDFGNGFVFLKDFNCVSEAKSLNSIRTALENLEDHLEFLHNMQDKQRAERDAALARLEQSRIILSLRLAQHHGKKYQVIDEAINFVGDATCFTRPTRLMNPQLSAPAEHSMQQNEVSSNLLMRVLLSGFSTAKRMLQRDKMGGLLGNAALFALSMLALLHLQQVTYKDNELLDVDLKQAKTGKKSTRVDYSFSSGSHLDVRLARG